MKNGNKKKLPLLLGALLLLSIIAYGTRAYFSDSTSQDAGIHLTLGTLEVTSSDQKNWVYVPITEEVDSENAVNQNLSALLSENNEISDASAIENVRPGDKFTREFTFKNTGDLDAKISTNTLKGDGAFTVNLSGSENNAVIPAGSEVTYTLTIQVDPTVGNAYNKTSSEYDSANKVALDFLKESVSVELFQTNKN